LDEAGQLSLVRVYQLILLRLGLPDSAGKQRLIERLDREFPARSAALNRELAETLIALDVPAAVPKTLQLLAVARDEDIDYGSAQLLERNLDYAKAFSEALASRPNVQQIAYAYALRVARSGWNPALRKAYFGWFPRTAPWQGGNSFRGFLENIRQEALEKVPDAAERALLAELSSRPTVPQREYPLPKGPGRDYTVAEVLALADVPLAGRDFENGRAMFHTTACYACHRFDGSGGGLGPDLTTTASRFSLRDLVENIVEPSQVISDQYGSESVELTDGTMLIGRAYEENDRLHVVYDPRNPDEREEVDLARVKTRRPYPVSFMPTGLLNGLNPEEVLDLLGYVLSGGDREHPMFKAQSAGR
jgi:putative heme-binding domain-containing protein